MEEGVFVHWRIVTWLVDRSNPQSIETRARLYPTFCEDIYQVYSDTRETFDLRVRRIASERFNIILNDRERKRRVESAISKGVGSVDPFLQAHNPAVFAGREVLSSL